MECCAGARRPCLQPRPKMKLDLGCPKKTTEQSRSRFNFSDLGRRARNREGNGHPEDTTNNARSTNDAVSS